MFGGGGAATGAAFGAALSAIFGGDPGLGAASGALLGATSGAAYGASTAGARRWESRIDSTEELAYVIWQNEQSVPSNTLAHGYIFFPSGNYTRAVVTFRTHPSGWTPTFEIPLK
jgi:hypothetical protein